jgi:hypothetical protein
MKLTGLPILVIAFILISLIYLLLSIYFMNMSLVKDTILGHYPFNYKFTLLVSLIEGIFTAFSIMTLLINLILAVLTSCNILLIYKKYSLSKKSANVHLLVSSSSLLGILGGGCVACGMPLLSFLGVGSSIVSLPFSGSHFSIIPIFSILMLLVSIIILLRRNNSCPLPSHTAGFE